MPWIPTTTIASSAGTSAKFYPKKPMKNNKLLLIILIAVLLLIVFPWNALANRVYFQAAYNESIAYREHLSLTMRLPNYKVEQTYQITHSDGTPLMFNVTKFECCDAPTAMVKDGQLYFDYYNTVQVVPLGATNTDIKVDVPEFRTETVIHELCHRIINKHTMISNPKLEERMCYDFEHLYTQIKSLDEDNRFKLIK